MSETILTISHLRKDFGSNQVLKDVDFQVKKGDVTCIIGASGSGKSTLVHLLDRLYDLPEGSGTITIGGVDSPTTFDAGIGAYVGMALASVGGMAWMRRRKR